VKKIYRLLVIALVIRLVLTPFGTLSLDFNTFVAWSDRLVEYGSGTFYAQWSDYLPGYLYVLWGVGLINNIIHIPAVYLYKLPAIVADLATGWVIYKVVSVKKNQRKALWWSGAYLFNPAILANSTLWGQVDSLTALSVVLSLWLVNINLVLSAVALAVGTLIKPQVVFVVPVLALVIMQSKDWFRKISIYTAVGAGVFVVGFLPFKEEMGLVNFVVKRVFLSLGQYPYTSVNAFNFWGLLLGLDRLPDNFEVIFGLTLNKFAWAMGFGFIFLVTYWYWRGANLFFYILMLFYSIFMFFPRVHERYLFPVIAIFPFVLIAKLGFKKMYYLITAVFFLNLYHWWWFPRINALVYVLDLGFVERTLSLMNLVLFGTLLREYRKSRLWKSR